MFSSKSRVFYLLIILCLTLILYSKELSLLIYPNSYVQVRDYITDEFNFYNIIKNYSLQNGMIAGYGYIFWELSHLIIKVFSFAFSTQIIILRSIFLMFKYIAFILAAFSCAKLKDNFCGMALYLTLLITPGFYFYGKVFSPEYLLLFLAALTLFSLAYDYFYLAIFAAITTVFLKIYSAPILLPVAFYALRRSRKEILIGILVASISITLNSIPLFTSAGLHNTLNGFHRTISPFVFSLHNIKQWLHLNTRTWDQIPLGGIYIDFSPILFIPIALLLSNSRQRNFISNFLPIGATILLSGIFLTVTILCYSVKQSWYLFLPYFITQIGLFLTFYNGQHKVIIVIIVFIIFSLNYPRIHWRMQDRSLHNHLLKKNKIIYEEINYFLYNHYPKGGLILTDVLIGSNTKKPFKVIPLSNLIPQQHYKNKARFLILNHQIKGGSPLAQLIFNNKIPREFTIIKNFNGLILMKKKSN